MKVLEVNRIEKVDIILTMSIEELVVLRDMIGEMGTSDFVKYGVPKEQTQLVYDIYEVLDNVT